MTGVEGEAKSRASISPASKAVRPAFDGEAERVRHRHRIGGLGNGGVEQHGVVAEFERVRRMRGRAQTGIDHQRDVGQPVAQQFERVAVDDPLGAADRRCPRHHHLAAGIDQPHRDAEILGAIGEYFKAVLDQDAGRFDQPDHVGLQRVVVGDHFQLDPGRGEQFARQLCGGDRLADAAAAGGVRQHRDIELADQRPERIAGLAAGRLRAAATP